MQFHLFRLHLQLARLDLHVRHLHLRQLEPPLRGEQFARELLAVALPLLHGPEVLAQVVELRRHGQDLVLQLRARRRVPALDAGRVELRQRQRHHLDRPRLQVEIGVGKFGQRRARRARGPGGSGER